MGTSLRVVFACAVLLVGFALPARAQSDAGGRTIRNGRLAVTVDRMGLITSISPCAIVPTYGPRVPLNAASTPGGTAALVEWYGLEFDSPAGHVSAAASDVEKDYAPLRRKIEFVRFHASASEAVSITRIDDVEIRTTISFDPQSPCLLIGVELLNLGKTEVRDILVSREWRVRDAGATTFPPDWASMMPPAPADVHRILYMPNNLRPGCRQAAAMAFEPLDDGGGFRPAADDVPLRLWTNATWPSGLDYGATFGISVGDHNHDGWYDVVTCYGKQLWENEAGVDWAAVGNLKRLLGNELSYGACFADYDNDNLPDLGTEPRGNCMHLLKNRKGNGKFDDFGGDSSIVDVQPCDASSETLCTVDTDGDGNLDWFLPTYPVWLGSTGNWFLQNLGPVGPDGAYAFHEDSAGANLDNPDGVNRPEGAGWVDIDQDGDSDLYSNGTLYRNISVPGTPLFDDQTEVATGIIHSDILDEGAGFLDYDMDGDFDLCVAFCDATLGVRMFESQGDGTFFLTDTSTFDSYNTGLCLGLSFEDWDNDGDVDVTSSEVFRRNQWMETGQRHFTVASHSIPKSHITDATPAWFDFDHDGDLDCALGNFGSHGHYYENYLYDSSTPLDQRRYVRVRPVRDSANFDEGLATEEGAIVSIHPLGASDDGMKRVKVVSDSNGYLNQNEYTLHFGLPPDPDPDDPAIDLEFEVTVDFKGARNQGFLRVDRHVNPVLGDIRLADLVDREIVVYRSGRVRMNGCDFPTSTPAQPLTTTTDGLVTPGVNTTNPPILGSPASDWFVGIEVSTAGAPVAQRIEELILDGQVDTAVDCGGIPANVFVWDVTHPGRPDLVANGSLALQTQSRNNRSFLPIDVTLRPDRLYRIVARVTSLRATSISGPVMNGALTTNGGLSFGDSSPCTGAAADAAAVDPADVYLAVRFRDEPHSPWVDLGHGLGGALGEPVLTGHGDLFAGWKTSLALSNAAVDAPFFLVIGTAVDCLPFAGGTIVPVLDFFGPAGTTDATGLASLSGTWPGGVPGGFTFYAQEFVVDGTAPHGLAFSNAVAGTTPY
jgi:hypothetical protein